MKSRVVNEDKKVTFSDISKATGLSKTTISRYFNNPDYLSKENAETISHALSELKYQENKLAKVLAKGNTEFIGIIVPNFFHQFYSFFIDHILSTYDQYGYKFITFLGRDNAEAEKRYINELLSYQIEGLIELSHNIHSSYFASLSIPVVTIEREDQFINSVNTNNLLGAKYAVELLERNNCEVLFHINNKISSHIPAYARTQGFIDTCQEKQIESEVFIHAFNDNYNETYQVLENLYFTTKKKYPKQKKGFFFCNDTYANIFLNILIMHHENVPDDYELIGFDNSPVSQQAIIPITTISQNMDKLAENAIMLLEKQIKGGPTDGQTLEHIIVNPTMIERSTTRSAPQRSGH